MKSNVLRCRHCRWETTKWGARSTLEQAWARLRQHIRSDHGQADDVLDAAAEGYRDFEAAYLDSFKAPADRRSY